uniref:Uncharacterized protein n=1 Tax=Anopheles maculatus TaxID=74869 RepID=A0A182SAV8_9DIPT
MREMKKMKRLVVVVVVMVVLPLHLRILYGPIERESFDRSIKLLLALKGVLMWWLGTAIAPPSGDDRMVRSTTKALRLGHTLQMVRIVLGRWIVVALVESGIARCSVHHLCLAVHHVAHRVRIAGRWARMCVH